MDNNKLNLILDLDQTLISAKADNEYDIKNVDMDKKAQKFEFQDMDKYYIIFERPGLQKFLDFIFKNFNVSIWTAASQGYALFIIDKIIVKNKKERVLDWIFFRYHCNISEKIYDTSKNLEIIWKDYKIQGYNKHNTIILDDYKEDVYSYQKDNCILAKLFEFSDQNSEHDDFLQKLQHELSKYIDYKTNPAKTINDALVNETKL
jgi:TFIIF-interacting CTD phosphatase-like protein